MTYHTKHTTKTANTPLFLTFHGTSGSKSQFHNFAKQLIPGTHITSPHRDVSKHKTTQYFKHTNKSIYNMDNLALRSRTMADFITTKKATTKPTHTIRLGYSNKANILTTMAMLNAGLVDDLILMHPLIPFAPAPQPGLRRQRVLITAGQNDPICPPNLTHTLAEYLIAQKTNMQIHWHASGHTIAQSKVATMQDFLIA